MPSEDGTGPSGQGPMTGRGFGPCGLGFARRLRIARGFGRGFDRRRDQITLTKEQEKRILKAELFEVEVEKAEIEKRLKEIKSD